MEDEGAIWLFSHQRCRMDMLELHGIHMGAYRDVAHPECQLTRNRSSGPTFVVN